MHVVCYLPLVLLIELEVTALYRWPRSQAVLKLRPKSSGDETSFQITVKNNNSDDEKFIALILIIIFISAIIIIIFLLS